MRPSFLKFCHDCRYNFWQFPAEHGLNSRVYNLVDCGQDLAARSQFCILQHARVGVLRVNRFNEASQGEQKILVRIACHVTIVALGQPSTSSALHQPSPCY